MRTHLLLSALIASCALIYWAQHSREPARQGLSSATSSPPAQVDAISKPEVTQREKRDAVTGIPPRLSAPEADLEPLLGDSAVKEQRRPLNATLKTVSPSPRDASWRPGQTLELGWHEAPLPEGEGHVRVRLSMSAERAEGHRVAAALRPRVLKSLYFLLKHRASGALTLPDAEARLAKDLNERLARMSAGYQLEVHVEALEVHFK